MATKKRRQRRFYIRPRINFSPRHYARGQEKAIRAGFRSLESYMKTMVWKLTNEVKDDPPERRR